MRTATLAIAAALCLLLGLAGCTEKAARELVRGEKRAGHDWRYCDLAKQYVGSDRSLLVDLGECYEHGWGELPQDREAAVNYYEQGARWGNRDAIDALKRLGVDVPEPDLLHEEHKHLDERRSDELRHALLLAVVGTEKSISRHPRYDPVSGALGAKPGTNIAGSPAFEQDIAERTRNGLGPPCALVYVKGHRVEPVGECK